MLCKEITNNYLTLFTLCFLWIFIYYRGSIY